MAELVALAQRELSAAVAAPDRHKARMLLRLFAALVVANVLHPSSVVAGLQQVVDTAVAVGVGGAASSGLSPALSGSGVRAWSEAAIALSTYCCTQGVGFKHSAGERQAWRSAGPNKAVGHPS